MTTVRDRAPGSRDYADLPHSCRCGKRSAGGLTAHCGNCHRTFTGVGGFDRHRRNGACLDPTTVGMTLAVNRAYECWTTTEHAADDDV